MAQGVGCEVREGASLAEKLGEDGPDLGDQVVVDAGAVDGRHGDVVEVLDQQPPAGRRCPHQPVQYIETLRQVKKDEPFMDEIPRSFGDGLTGDVVATDLELRLAPAIVH